MVLRHVTVELTEKQYETLCRMTANAGMPVADVIQAFNQLDDADQLELLTAYQSDVFLNE